MLKYLAIGAFIILVVGLLWWRTKKSAAPSIDTATNSTLTARGPLNRTSQSSTVFASDSASESSNTSDAFTAPILQRPVVAKNSAAQQQVDQVAFVLRDYRLTLSQNPEGTNAEITAALLGNNLKQARFEIPEGSTVKNNELCDSWGTAYFFHQISKTTMEIRSAGPDRAMWTNDDLIAR